MDYNDRIREMLCDSIEADNHIRVTLDFVPVEETLPNDYRAVFVLEKWDDSPLFGRYNQQNGLWFSQDAYGEESDRAEVTHWAEIPTIKEAL